MNIHTHVKQHMSMAFPHCLQLEVGGWPLKHTPPLGATVTHTLANSDKHNIPCCLPVMKKMVPKTIQWHVGMLKLFRGAKKSSICFGEEVSG